LAISQETPAFCMARITSRHPLSGWGYRMVAQSDDNRIMTCDCCVRISWFWASQGDANYAGGR
jgi:hypothetical protein